MFSIKKIITISDYFTMINILLGFCGIIFCDFRFIYLGIVFDGLDGYIARKTNTVSDFGAQLDSICDVVTFGVAPAYLLHFFIGDIFSLIGGSLFLIFGGFRLARFNILNTKNFIGLPIPAGALILCITVDFIIKYNIVNYFNILISLLAVIYGLLMISDIEYPKFKNKFLMALFFIGVILSLFGFFELLGMISIIYVLYGIINYLKK